MLRTNNNKFKDKVFAYIMDIAENSFFDDNNNNEYNEQAAAAFIYDSFKAEYNNEYNKKRYPNLQNRVSAWLQGLGLPVECGEYECIEIMASWQKVSHEQAAKTLQRWSGTKGFYFTGFCNLLACFILKLWVKNKINVYKLNM